MSNSTSPTPLTPEEVAKVRRVTVALHEIEYSEENYFNVIAAEGDFEDLITTELALRLLATITAKDERIATLESQNTALLAENERLKAENIGDVQMLSRRAIDIFREVAIAYEGEEKNPYPFASEADETELDRAFTFVRRHAWERIKRWDKPCESLRGRVAELESAQKWTAVVDREPSTKEEQIYVEVIRPNEEGTGWYHGVEGYNVRKKRWNDGQKWTHYRHWQQSLPELPEPIGENPQEVSSNGTG